MSKEFWVYAACDHCGHQREIATFDNKPDATAYAKEQRRVRPEYTITIEEMED